MIYTDDMCVALFFNGNRQKTIQQKNVLFKKYDGIENYLKERYPDSSCIEETLFRIKNNLEERPVCKTCHGHLTFNKNKRKFPTYCSPKCSNSDPDKIEKTAQVKFEKYGSRTYNNSRKAAETCNSRYGVTSYAKTSEFANKVKKTSQEKYGCNWFMQTNAFRSKSKQTKTLKYGNENYNNRAKAEITTLSKYGVKNTKQAESSKQKEKETCLKKYGVTSYSKTSECKQKHKDAFLKKYGVEHNTKSAKWKEKWYGNEEWVKKRNEHIYESMKNNGSFPMSKKENMIYERLKQEYPDIIREYKDDERYPFKCDFYIPSIDMFIEYDGHWTHGKHDFNPSNIKDQETLKKWKSKNNEQYKLAVKVWTEKDPLKRKYAKENNLNYVVLKYDDYKNLPKIVEKINKVWINHLKSNMEINHLIIGDVIRYNDDNVYYNNCVGRVVKYGPQAQRIVEFRIGEDYEQVALPANSLDAVEILYRAPRDNDIVREWADWDACGMADAETIHEVTNSGTTKWDDAVGKIDSEVTEAINPDYSSPEEAAEDIFGDKTVERLKALREKYHIPEPDKDIIEALEKGDK